ncbi:MAG: FHA domain-containing protein [Anaerolineae bacterium]|nr:FHA domain-containing protein [Anaerolineae bacterium]
MVRYIADTEDEFTEAEFQTIQEAPPTAYLTLVAGGRLSHSFPLRGEVRLGREKSNAIVVADQKVSRHHASFTPIDNTFIISDQGSANGTYVNGVLIGQPTRLKNNDRVSVGDTHFLFTTAPPDSNAPDRPAPPLSPPPASVPVASGVAAMASGNNTSLWMLFGCMALVIIVLLFIVAVFLGIFVGRAQLLGWVMLGLAQGSGWF